MCVFAASKQNKKKQVYMIVLPQTEVAQCEILKTLGRILILVGAGGVCGVSVLKCFKVMRGRRAWLCPGGESTALSYSCWCFPGHL